MEQIAKLLFALTVLSIFAYILIYSSMSSVGNGGEYWGFDGRTEPHIAAGTSFDAGTFELLALDIANPLGGRISERPKPISCSRISGRITTSIRWNELDGIHSSDSVRLAREFSQRYNRYMSGLMQSSFGYKCAAGSW